MDPQKPRKKAWHDVMHMHSCTKKIETGILGLAAQPA